MFKVDEPAVEVPAATAALVVEVTAGIVPTIEVASTVAVSVETATVGTTTTAVVVVSTTAAGLVADSAGALVVATGDGTTPRVLTAPQSDSDLPFGQQPPSVQYSPARQNATLTCQSSTCWMFKGKGEWNTDFHPSNKSVPAQDYSMWGRRCK